MIARSFRRSTSLRPAFTLVEMLITVTIISMMAGMVLFAMYGAQEAAKRQKTEALIARIDAVLKSKWESYRSRRVPVVIPADEPYDDANNNGRRDASESFTDLPWSGATNNEHDTFPAARIKLDALHDLMRLEMPDRWTDVSDNPTSFGYRTFPSATSNNFTVSIARPSVSQGYLRKYTAAKVGMGGPDLATAQEYQGAECLYMIIQACSAEEGDDVSTILKPENVRDTDGDTFPEIVDAWGMPIRFLRWAPGFPSARSIMYTARYGGTTGTGADQHREEFYVTGPGVPQDGKGIIGGAVIEVLLNQNSMTGWNFVSNSAQITAYFFEPDNMTNPPTPRGRVVCTTPSSVVGVPNSLAGQIVAFVGPDPFDPLGVYRQDKNAGGVPPYVRTGPTFAMYPLVYSAGPDKSYGVVSDVTSAAIQYSTVNANPFLKPSGGAPLGTTTQIAGEQGDWKDNIHNHALGQR